MESDSITPSSKEDVNGDTSVIPTPRTKIEEEPASFPRFDAAASGDEIDHFYFKDHADMYFDESPYGSPASPTAPSAVTPPVQKKIMQEWKILEKNLPDSIYVRVYESRIDLMRAAIVGAAGTPYHDGLFFFDISFPSNYPASPPRVHYKSFGVRINPNLYSSGKVCLSLLNTWSGKKTERWDPNGSTILQVLLSIQALVLNENPYFNEPALLMRGIMPRKKYWEKKSAAYSEDVFILSCKTMMWLLRRPPKGYDSFISSHFRGRAGTILDACNAYFSAQAKIGCYGIASVKPHQISAPSAKFKSLIKEVYRLLLQDFLKAGASVGNFSHQLQDTAEVTSSSHESGEEKTVRKKNKHIFVNKILRKLGKLLGLQNIMNRKKKKDDKNDSIRKGKKLYHNT
ncbi:hypothetical protein SAY86_007273 [Trapa natans]|uniref:UBC core domain-containing protein n=1 Tax=Trapa natans TaxID=22666 RepID=A0AAN7QWU4_TRANT|nr:hypothetical protein SAY86_007273 [Trapa natans]